MTSTKEYHLTAEGAAKLQVELEELKGPRRKELAQRLRAAIQQGDLSENADYSKAKEDQAFLEGRIQEIEVLLSNAVIISKESKPNGVIGIGSTVKIKEDGRDAAQYYLVGAQEADPRNGRISNESPIGRALIGHQAGETVEVSTPSGTLTLQIVEVA